MSPGSSASMPHAGPSGSHALNLGLADADVPTLIAIWLGELDRFTAVAAALTDEQWRAASSCPGWTVGDVVAHVIALESELHGDPLPQHKPDWTSLPHVLNDFAEYIEVPVDVRRGRSREDVVAELTELVAARHDDLADAPTDPDQLVPTFAGMQVARKRAAQMRILDVWVHEQDVRDGAGRPGGLDTDAAWVTAGRFTSGLPYVWGKVVGAPIGATLEVDVTGPGVIFTRTVQVGSNGRAQLIDSIAEEPDVRLWCPWPTFSHLCAGRLGSAGELATGAVVVEGDHDLGRRLLPSLAVTP
ncbi:MAG: maleylpyruvate isomerase family mycothiol-dependent enzyme [Actinomycetes bacterium]